MTELTQVIGRAVKWLVKNQDAHNGGWPEHSGKPVSILNTAEAIIALRDGEMQSGDKRVLKGIRFLLDHQAQEGEDSGAWQREVEGPDGEVTPIPDIVRTAFAVEALVKAGAQDAQKPLEAA